jgi:hypothetical protein
MCNGWFDSFWYAIPSSTPLPLSYFMNSESTIFTCDAPEAEWGGLIAINCFPVTA